MTTREPFEELRTPAAVLDSTCHAMARWWRHTQELEAALGYRHAGAAARLMWDQVVHEQVGQPYEPVYSELWACARLWTIVDRARPPGSRPGNVLDTLMAFAERGGMRMPGDAILAASRLRRALGKQAARIECAEASAEQRDDVAHRPMEGDGRQYAPSSELSGRLPHRSLSRAASRR